MFIVKSLSKYKSYLAHVVIVMLIVAGLLSATGSHWLALGTAALFTVLKEVADKLSEMKRMPVAWYRGTYDYLDMVMFVPGAILGLFLAKFMLWLLSTTWAAWVGLALLIIAAAAVGDYLLRMRSKYMDGGR